MLKRKIIEKIETGNRLKPGRDCLLPVLDRLAKQALSSSLPVTTTEAS